MKKGISTVCYTLGAAFLLWLSISFVDVVAHNNNTNPQYQPWNAFCIMNEHF